MNQFQKKFIEEATDLVNTLESAILKLEDSPNDLNLINELFRIMHSLKGAGAMFGFDTISNYTHNLENIYDQIRSETRKVTPELIDITFSSVDHIRNLLDEDLSQTKEVLNKNNELLNVILKIYSGDNSSGKGSQNQSGTSVINNDEKTYYIFIKPNIDIFDNGTNPLFLIDELNQLGKCKIFVGLDEIPSIEKIERVECYTYWEVFLQTKNSTDEIEEIFMFVEDDCKLEITEIADAGMLENEEFIGIIENPEYKNIGLFDPAQLKTIAYRLIVEKREQSSVSDENIDDDKVNQRIEKFSKESEISSIRVATKRIDQFVNLVSELVTAQAGIKLYSEKTKDPVLLEISENIEDITSQLRDNALSMSLIPIENIVVRFKRLVRDISTSFNKKINFLTEGTDTELDKTLVQALTDPLMHILRNSIDHGIEDEQIRLSKGKPAVGTIMLRAFYSGSDVIVEVEDDGAGLDPDKIKKKAIEKNIIKPNTILTNQEIIELIFTPGFSTAEKVTDISGRGVGMDVLRRKISDVRGNVMLHSVKNKGTKIRIKLPLTLSIIDGLMVVLGNTNYIIPLISISKIRDVKFKELEAASNNMAIIDNVQTPFYLTREIMEIEGKYPDEVKFICVKFLEKEVGLVFDNIEGELQVVLKPLGTFYKNQDIISGATILGDGNICLVLDTNKIVENFMK